ncbi:adenylate kinase 2 [Drosophila kikkawai]|uniref:Adenylate kinase 2 n=1 Tax=Drosophila kikkawai TaxID=30033 RepID=A0A6P4HX74_DROKI|nr:probable adenylate kinase 2, chloroplastic [Drosophila kikkawai]
MSCPKKFNKEMLVAFGAAFMHYIEKHKLMEVMSRILAEILVADDVTDVRLWMGQNIRRIGVDIYSKSLDAFHRGVQGDFYQLPRNFYHRIVIHGKPGSGRKSLAHVLAQRWDLLILDVDVLIYHSINGAKQNEHTRLLQEGIEEDCVYKRSEAVGNLIQSRLLQDDALHRGWILFNYPNNKCEAKHLFEGFTVPPNKFIFLQIDERMAKIRILVNSYSPGPQSNISYLDRQMQQFRKSEPALNAYLSQRREVIYVDATPCFEQVKCEIISQLTKTPYILGKKYGEANALV